MTSPRALDLGESMWGKVSRGKHQVLEIECSGLSLDNAGIRAVSTDPDRVQLRWSIAAPG